MIFKKKVYYSEIRNHLKSVIRKGSIPIKPLLSIINNKSTR